MDQATQTVSSSQIRQLWIDGGCRVRVARPWTSLGERAVRAMRVVVVEEFDDHRLQVVSAENEDAIEALAAKGPDHPDAHTVEPRG